MPLPVGLVYDTQSQWTWTPITGSTKHPVFVSILPSSGSADAMVKTFREPKLLFPRRLRKGREGELVWRLWISTKSRSSCIARLCRRFRTAKSERAKRSTVLTSDKTAARRMVYPAHWRASRLHHMERIPGEPATASRERACAWPGALRGPPGEGPLLQGLAVCGVCGGRMNVAYHVRAFRPGRSVPHYFCQGAAGLPAPVCLDYRPGRGPGRERLAPGNHDAGDHRHHSGSSARIASASGRGGPVTETAGGTRSA